MTISGSDPLRVVIHYSHFMTGGAERSTLRMMQAMVAAGWKVTLVLNLSGGTLEPSLPDEVEVIHLDGGLAKRAPWMPAKALGILSKAIRRVKEHILSDRAFDLGIIGLQGLSPRLMCRTIRPRRVALWVRSDLSSLKRIDKVRPAFEIFAGCIDHVVAVSDNVRERGAAAFPDSGANWQTIYNFIQSDTIRQFAAGPSPFPDGESLRVVTACRLDEAPKALLRMVKVHRRLIERGVSHEWHIVGDGPDRARLEAAIASAGVGKTMILHGAQDNPYPYLANADIVAVLSRYEGLSGVVNEAKILERPVIATQVSSIEEQIGRNQGGLVVAQDEDAIVEVLERLIGDPELRRRLAAHPLPEAIADDAGKLSQVRALAQ